jgi:hypothetical protein
MTKTSISINAFHPSSHSYLLMQPGIQVVIGSLTISMVELSGHQEQFPVALEGCAEQRDDNGGQPY